MILYNRTEFLALKAGVVFTKDDGDIDGFMIKGDTIGLNDFNYKHFASIDTGIYEDYHNAVLDLRNTRRADADFDDYSRDGLYEDTQKFVVLEYHEVCRLIKSLVDTLVEGYGY